MANRTKGVQILQSPPDPDARSIADRRRDPLPDHAYTPATLDQSALHSRMVTMATNPSGFRNECPLQKTKRTATVVLGNLSEDGSSGGGTRLE